MKLEIKEEKCFVITERCRLRGAYTQIPVDIVRYPGDRLAALAQVAGSPG